MKTTETALTSATERKKPTRWTGAYLLIIPIFAKKTRTMTISATTPRAAPMRTPASGTQLLRIPLRALTARACATVSTVTIIWTEPTAA